MKIQSTKGSPHSRQNDHDQKTVQRINAEGVLENCVATSFWWDVTW